MKAHGGVEVQLHSELTLVLDGGEWLPSCLRHVTLRERPAEPEPIWMV